MTRKYPLLQGTLVLTKKAPPRTITLIGSTKFKPLFIHYCTQFNKLGDIVYMPTVFSSYDNATLNNYELRTYAEMTKNHISISDFVFVINSGRYIGSSTQEEIDFAHSQYVPVLYMEPAFDVNAMPIDFSDPTEVESLHETND